MTDKTDKKGDAEVLEALRDFRERAEAYWSDIYDAALEDIEFIALSEKQWKEADAKARRENKKPVMTFNKLALFVRMQVNALRAEGLGVNVIPVDDTDVADAELREKLLQHVYSSSRADIAKEWAYKQANMGGFGFYRITTEYESENSFNKNICVKRIENQFSTYISPESRCPAGSDATEALTGEWVSKAEFEAQYPNEEAISAEFETGRENWEMSDAVYIAEYYRVETTDDTLYQLADGQTILKSQLDQYQGDPNNQIVQERTVQRPQIMWYKCTHSAVLESTEVEGKHIPIVMVSGTEEWVKDKRYLFGLVHDAKDSQTLYNYARNAQAEQLRKAGNRPYVAAAEATEGYEDQWENADDPSVKTIYYNHVDQDRNPLPVPFLTQAYQGSPDLMREVMTSSEEIKDITGIHESSMGMQGNETSGKAIMARQKQGQIANYHILDNYKISEIHCATIVLGMMPGVFDTARILRITDDRGDNHALPINQPPDAIQRWQKELKDKSESINRLFNDMSVGRYDVRIATGVDFNTQREESREMIMELSRSNPQLTQVAGDLLIAAFDFPDAKKIAERIKRSIPKELLDEEDRGDDEQMPPQALQIMEKLKEAMQQIEQMSAELNDKKADREKDVLIAQIKAEADIEREVIKATAGIDEEQIKQLGNAAIAGDEYSQGMYRTVDPPPKQMQTTPPPNGGFFMPDLPAQTDGQSLNPAQMADETSPYPA